MKFFFKKRYYTRQLLIQALYQWYIANTSLREILEQFKEKYLSKKADGQYFETTISNIVDNIEKLDKTMELFLDRERHTLDPIVVSVLRLSVYELAYQYDIPYKVVINEALELTKLFGSDESYKYVNSILDKAAVQLRQEEITHKQPKE